jgi:enterochelin esterase-like enzyme
LKSSLQALLCALWAPLSLAAMPAGPSATHDTEWGHYEQYVNVTPAHVAARDVTVFIPRGTAPKEGYAVLYVHDGQNVFDPATATAHEPWAIDRAVHDAGRPIIVVAVNNSAQRWSEYMPKSAYEALPEALQDLERDTQSAPLSDRYVDFLADELKPYIDSHYPTRRDAAHTYIAGSSMGGLVSIYAMERRPEVFGRAAGLSTHWPSTVHFALYGHGADSADPLLAIIGHVTVDTLAEQLPDPATHRLWVDYGDQTLDQYYAPYAERFRTQAAAHGWRSQLAVRRYPGASHAEPSWRERFPEVIEFLVAP